jgi:hypothetical protein
VFAGTGPVHGVLVALGLVIWVAAVCLVGAGTSRLRRRGVYTVGFLDAPFRPAHRWAARPRRSDPAEWFLRAIIGVAVLACLAMTLPDQVNAVALLTDSTSTAVFVPRSYIQDCGKDSCTTKTAGTLEGSGLPAVWPAEVPLDRPFLVQAPVWPAGSNPTLMTSTAAIGYTLLAMVIDVAAVSMLSGYVLRLRRRLRGRERRGWLLPRPR